MPEKGTAQWTLRQTPERQRQVETIRLLLSDETGERQNGVITTSQILDWALALLEQNARGRFPEKAAYIDRRVKR